MPVVAVLYELILEEVDKCSLIPEAIVSSLISRNAIV
jgi:hypothetical protein